MVVFRLSYVVNDDRDNLDWGAIEITKAAEVLGGSRVGSDPSTPISGCGQFF